MIGVRKTATGDVTTADSVLHGIIVETGGTAPGRLTLRDGAVGADILFDVSTAEIDRTIPMLWGDDVIRFPSGLHISAITNIDAVTLLLS